MPIRMCMVCRRRRDKSELVRAVSRDNEIVADRTGKQQCRGFYLCPECLGEIKKKRVFERVLKRSVDPEMYTRFIEEVSVNELQSKQ